MRKILTQSAHRYATIQTIEAPTSIDSILDLPDFKILYREGLQPMKVVYFQLDMKIPAIRNEREANLAALELFTAIERHCETEEFTQQYGIGRIHDSKPIGKKTKSSKQQLMQHLTRIVRYGNVGSVIRASETVKGASTFDFRLPRRFNIRAIDAQLDVDIASVDRSSDGEMIINGTRYVFFLWCVDSANLRLISPSIIRNDLLTHIKTTFPFVNVDGFQMDFHDIARNEDSLEEQE